MARRDRKHLLNEGQCPHFRGVRAALGVGYIRVRGIRRASKQRLTATWYGWGGCRYKELEAFILSKMPKEKIDADPKGF